MGPGIRSRIPGRRVDLCARMLYSCEHEPTEEPDMDRQTRTAHTLKGGDIIVVDNHGLLVFDVQPINALFVGVRVVVDGHVTTKRFAVDAAVPVAN